MSRAYWHRGLTPNDERTIELSNGAFGWRITPPKVNVRNEDGVLEQLHAKGLVRFIRVVNEINKEAILVEPDAIAEIKGLTVANSEQFWAKPFESNIEDTRVVRATKNGGKKRT
ncbi:hypothetical protein CCP3SC15_330001 [Gammaproteobacteria bacterium]